MRPARRKFLLALIGALSAVVAFALAAPYIETLAHPGLSQSDPAFKYAFGTQWALVEYAANGALLIGPICFVLVLANRGIKWALGAGILGLVLGLPVGYAANGGADLLGIGTDRHFGSVPFLPQIIWSILVPAAYAFAIALVVGPTPSRLKRALYAAVFGAMGSFVAVVAAEVVVQVLIQTGRLNIDPAALQDGGSAWAKASVPVWEATAAAAGLAIGAILGFAEQQIRPASLKLILGRNEGRDWSLDSAVNRIGSAEGLEVYLRGMNGVAPIHARVVYHPEGYGIEETGAGPIILNGVPVQGGAWLNSGDAIGIGSAMLQFSSQINARGGQAAAPMQVARLAPAPAHYPGQIAVQTVSHIAAKAAASPVHLLDVFGNEHPLHDGVNTIGREAGCDLVVGGDASVSRRHAEITLAGSLATVTDLGSKNGTRVNGHPVTGTAALNSGDQLQIGHVVFTFHI